jgi:tRNA-specific adenosine deaminase 1
MIAEAVLEQYAKLGKNGKPTTSGSKTQWTVLAGVVKQELGSIECVALATGLKCQNTLHKEGHVVNDSHAEVLAVRAFRHYLMLQIRNRLDRKVSILQTDFTIPPGITFSMYISQAPCGDASMKFVNASAHFKKSKQPDKLVFRGREHLDTVGVLRTKPGRIDAKDTDCMSCSDKIAKWNVCGVSGALLSKIMKSPVYLKELVIGDYFDHSELQRSLNERIFSFKSPCEQFRANQLLILPTNTVFNFSQSNLKDLELIPSNQSLIWIKGFGSEVLVAGRKQGAVCKNGIWPSSSISILSKHSIWKLYKELSLFAIPATYYQAKRESKDYQSVKKKLFLAELNGWIVNSEEFEMF